MRETNIIITGFKYNGIWKQKTSEWAAIEHDKCIKFAIGINNIVYFLLRPRSLFIIYGNRPEAQTGRSSYFP